MVWGAIVALSAAQVIGGVLYSRLLFGKAWIRAAFPGKTEAQLEKIQRESFHVEFVVCIVSQVALVMAIHYVIGPYLGVRSVEEAVKVGLGMAALAMLVDVCHCAFSKRSVVGFIIDHLYNTCVFVSACASFAYFG
ncbi:uncharacterized protein LOC127841678 [Dreissena polymorpha]|uniref:Uncharacterized protein n=1 Tax=Dreissena polymorpha TaxID=45954 RepID=A0A9D4EK67_DREPO|nr:uncharacterized protein LOC127841678 [Dreissena polymorpha]KAH3781797.1 hypothetical protein DPMN_159703 [Dreissena polymorpha]